MLTQQTLQLIRKLKEEKQQIEVGYLKDDRPIQLVVRKKPRYTVYFRAKPSTAYNPTIPQIKARIRFGELAKLAKGKKFSGELPPAAEEVKRMKGLKFGRTYRPKKWEIILAEVL